MHLDISMNVFELLTVVSNFDKFRFDKNGYEEKVSMLFCHIQLQFFCEIRGVLSAFPINEILILETDIFNVQFISESSLLSWYIYGTLGLNMYISVSRLSLQQVIAQIEESDEEISRVFIEPPDGDISDGDSASEDEGGLIDNLSSKQLQAPAEVVKLNRESLEKYDGK